MVEKTQHVVDELRAVSARLDSLATSLSEAESETPDSKSTTEDEGAAKEASQESGGSVSYDDVKAAVIEAAKVDRNKAVEILQQFGASKAPELAESDYAAAVRKLKELSDG